IPVEVTRTPSLSENTGGNIKYVPTLAPTQGAGLNLQSPQVIASMDEIVKLYPYLPYQKDLTTKNSVQVSIIIPSKEGQDNNHTLLINVEGIVFQAPDTSPQYPVMKAAFIEVANDTLSWIKSKGADPSKILIKWGDRKFIQDRAAQWLSGM